MSLVADDSSPYPAVMANAREDLAGNIAGEFSPEDWQKILTRAAGELARSQKPQAEAWVDVIRAFHREKYWGFTPDYVRPKPEPGEKNLGLKFIWFSARSFLITKVIVLYSGARWTADYDPIWGYIFFGAMTFMVCSYGMFLWKYARGRKD